MDGTLTELGSDVPGESVFVETNGVRLHTVQAGSADGPVAVLLHGFPEFWYAWHDQIRPLASAGYRVVVPDQRGYNRSDKPDGVDAYRMDELAADVVGLLDAMGVEEGHVAGHDWGAAVAWWVALHRPERVTTLAAINVPHPTVFRRYLRRHWGQRLRSGYLLFYQLPAIPEATMRASDWRLTVRTMRRTSEPGTFSAADFERYRRAWNRPGALTSMLNWYRAVVRERPRPREETVGPPTLVVWGARDHLLERSMARASVECCRDGRLAMFEDATHWVHHEQPVAVADRLLDHFEG